MTCCSEEDAVLCTPDKTYYIRLVTLRFSRSVLKVSRSPEAKLLEPMLAVPKLHLISVLLKEHERGEGHEEEGNESFRGATRRLAWGQVLHPQWRGLQIIIFQGEAETV